MARPTKLTPDRSRRICDNVRLGMSYERAAMAAGISRQTLYRWRERGEAEAERLKESHSRPRKREADFVTFVTHLIEAEAVGEQTLVAKIQASASGGRQIEERRTEYDAKGKKVKEIVTVKQEPPHWPPAAWILERRHPERWMKREGREITGKDGKPLFDMAAWERARKERLKEAEGLKGE